MEAADRVEYVPLLKLLPAEKAALAQLGPADRRQVRPLFVLLNVGEKSVDVWLDGILDGLREAVPPYADAYLDWHALKQMEEAPRRLLEQARMRGISLIPCVDASWFVTRDAQPHLDLVRANQARGLGIRLRYEEVQRKRAKETLAKVLELVDLEPERGDLVLDLGALDDSPAEVLRRRARSLLAAVPEPLRWRSLVLQGTAFPKSLSALEAGKPGRFARTEWQVWNEIRRETSLPRQPLFGDAGIHHPEGALPVDVDVPLQWAPNLRYTSGEAWVCLKGVGARTTPSTEQLPPMARRFTAGDLAESFQGKTHCTGCHDLVRMARRAKLLASPSRVKQIGFIHHFTTVLRQLGSLEA